MKKEKLEQVEEENKKRGNRREKERRERGEKAEVKSRSKKEDKERNRIKPKGAFCRKNSIKKETFPLLYEVLYEVLILKRHT